ncbi:shikimate dehydrogenase [Streptomonospora wellingtoniae]|uniref:Shikimate dehydrogenase n=1 Tax=Streptomonospora wellingtoniae TaxID=3075544 RepID=A0ABU2KVU2_9ACTN|nr:shikimate dehydrogenase [Streptomonospora sp. DSM 45055]MDT0303292.1 shikimate dehydrogenase [Streptomonospora sp. DSM 45055]
MRAAVLGSPVGHSLSPVLHTAAYTALGLAGEWSYERRECTEAELGGFLKGCDDSWAGLSLTMPLKREALRLADEAETVAREVGGANTLVLGGGRSGAFNTDVHGIAAALREAGVERVASAAVLGGGATAASAVAALRDLGAAADGGIALLAREPARAAGTVDAAERMGVRLSVAPLVRIDDFLGVDVVVSTLPSGAGDAYAGAVAGCGAVVFDVVYTPWPTALAAAAQEAGRTVVGGFAMLLHQAARQVELMTGAECAPVEAMRTAGRAELDRRNG